MPAVQAEGRRRTGPGPAGAVGSCQPIQPLPWLVQRDSICFGAKGITSSHLSWLFCEVFFVSFSLLCSHLQGSNRGLLLRAAPFESSDALPHVFSQVTR